MTGSPLRLFAPDLGAKVVAIHRLIQGVRPSVDSQKLRAHYEAARFADLVGAMQVLMEVEHLLLTVGLVNRHPFGETVAAWLWSADLQYVYQGKDVSVRKIPLYLSRDFMAHAPFETTAFAIAHELSHLYLACKGSPLCKDERAVDACTMLMGFGELYAHAKEYRDPRTKKMLWRLWQHLRTGIDPHSKVYSAGYLTQDEVRGMNLLIRDLQTVR